MIFGWLCGYASMVLIAIGVSRIITKRQIEGALLNGICKNCIHSKDGCDVRAKMHVTCKEFECHAQKRD